MSEDFRFDPEIHEMYFDDGRRVTNEAIAEMVAKIDAEAGVRPGLVPGGKSLSGDGSYSPRIQVVLPRKVKAEVDARAKAAHMSTSKWVRRTIEQALVA